MRATPIVVYGVSGYFEEGGWGAPKSLNRKLAQAIVCYLSFAHIMKDWSLFIDSKMLIFLSYKSQKLSTFIKPCFQNFPIKCIFIELL